MDCGLLTTRFIKWVSTVFFNQGFDYVSVAGCCSEMNDLRTHMAVPMLAQV
jgi:hypothetical protein